MKDRPIPFSAPMVRALLNGSKTQTRRILSPQPVSSQTWGSGIPNAMPSHFCVHARWAKPYDKRLKDFMGHPDADPWLPCPYGKPGDRLWVREAWNLWGPPERQIVDYRATCPDADDLKWKPSIHMPRWASRLTLEIVSVRVERLKKITEEDAIAEGIERIGAQHDWPYESPKWRDYTAEGCYLDPRESYESLWESINGPGSWAANPWVWVVEFKKAEVTR